MAIFLLVEARFYPHLNDMLSAPFCGVHEPVKIDLINLQRRAREIATAAVVSETPVRRWTHRLDSVLLHPVFGPIILATIMFVMFQAVFAWSQTPVSWIEDLVAWLSGAATNALPPGLLRSMVVDGAIAGVGAVITFLPQILILFCFILLLEGTGYMVRAAFLMTLSWDVLSTLTPVDYLKFRDVLGTSSGFQSEQFREIEFRLGLKDPNFINHYDEGSRERAALEAALGEPSLREASHAALERAGFELGDRSVEAVASACPIVNSFAASSASSRRS